MENDNKSWWSKRTSMEKSLTLVCTVCALLSIGLLIGLIVVAVNNNSDDSSLEGVCFTKTCIAESSLLLSQMNLTADPCDDFYEFACGTFLQETIIPDDKTQVTAFSVIDNKLRQELKAIINEPIQDSEIEPFKNAKRLYRACTNTGLIETRGSTPVKTVIDSMGGWPAQIGSNWNQDDMWTWQKAMVNSRNNGYSLSYLFSFSVSSDNKDTTKRIIRIDQASLGLSREYLIKKLEEPFVVAYHSYQVDLAVLFGATKASAEQDMKAALEFEIELAEISMPREERREAEKLYNLRTINQIQADYPYNEWLPYFNSILPAESQLVATDTIIVGALTFFEKLAGLLQKTPKRVIANYIAWRQAVGSVNYLPENFRKRQLEYERTTSGRGDPDPRWLECVDIALNYYPHAFGALYVRKHFRTEAKEKALEMVKNIKDEFKIMLSEITWMDEPTKVGANKKADTIDEQIGFADELMDDAKIVEYYNTFAVTIIEEQYYESVFKMNVASTIRNNKRLREPVDKKEWTSQVTPAIVNAFYSSLENTIKFPAGILQGAFFNAERPQYMNYGGIGFVIGHEITHGFDDQGSQYDEVGNLRNWWGDVTRKAYLEKAECIINQYGNYTEPLTNLKLNGINTQGENIADNGGIKESYRAYVRWAEKNNEKRLPGLIDYSPQQMFWISAGQIWCSTYKEAAMKNRVTTGVHSPGQFRVNGPMSNSKDFADDFKCATTAKMHPSNKCEVW